MNCFVCNHLAEIASRRAYHYKGVSVADVYLLNVEVLRCQACGEESLMLPQVAKIHEAIGLAVARQPAHLSGADIKFLRRSVGVSVRDWAEKLGVAEATYSKWENSHRAITAQPDRLARLHYLSMLTQKTALNVDVAENLATILNVRLDAPRNFALVVDAKHPEVAAQYLSLDSPVLARSRPSLVQAHTLPAESTIATATLSGRLIKASALAYNLIGEINNAGHSLSFAA